MKLINGGIKIMKKFEYTEKYIQEGKLVSKLNDYGELGWQAIKIGDLQLAPFSDILKEHKVLLIREIL